MVPRAPIARAADRHGIRWRDGRLVIGMTAAELDMLRDRVTLLFLAIDRGEIALY